MDKAKDDNKKGFAHALWEKLGQFWPVSILLMAFTFLSSINEISKFSSYLSQFLIEWRQILHSIVAFPVNLVLRILKLPPVSLSSPIPEIIAFISLLIFSGLRSTNIETSHTYRAIFKFHKKIFSLAESKINSDASLLISMPLYVLMNIVIILFYLLPAALIAYFLIRNILPEKDEVHTILILFTLLPAIILMLLGAISKKSDEIMDKVWAVHFGGTLPLVLILSIFLVILSTALELIVPAALAFADRAT